MDDPVTVPRGEYERLCLAAARLDKIESAVRDSHTATQLGNAVAELFPNAQIR